MCQQGREIRHDELIKLLSLENNAKKLKWIREKLNEIYKKEFTKKRVTEQVDDLSYQTLYFLEERGKEPRIETIRKLAAHYNVPIEVFEKDKPIKPFFLGKYEDEQLWIETQKHVFNEEKEQTKKVIGDYNELPEYDEPPFASDEFSIEIDMKVFVGNESQPTMAYLLHDRTAINEDDIEDIRRQVSQLIQLLSRKYEQLRAKDIAIREPKRKKTTPEEAISSLQHYIESGKHERVQAELKERMSKRLEQALESKNTRPITPFEDDNE